MIIERLIEWMATASVDERIEATGALVRAWLRADLGEEEREAAEAAMTCILDDPQDDVRLALSEALGEISDPPRHLVLALAADEESVSLPILANSPTLLDGELIYYITNGTTRQHHAIAARAELSMAVCTSIAQNADAGVCLELLTNPACTLDDAGFLALAKAHGDHEDIRRDMLSRHDIGMKARILLIEKYAVSLLDDEIAEDERRRARHEQELIEVCDKAIITYAAQVSDDEISEIVLALIEAEKLTTAFLLRAICMGNLSIFAHSLAVLAGQSLGRVEKVLKDNRRNAFHAIYNRAELPAAAFGVFLATISAWRDALSNNSRPDPAKLPYLVTRQVLAGYEGDRNLVVDELLLLLRKICTEAARESARFQVEQIALKSIQLAALPEPEPIQMSEEELMEFAVHLADELADLAIEDEHALAKAAAELEIANREKAWQARLALAVGKKQAESLQAGETPGHVGKQSVGQFKPDTPANTDQKNPKRSLLHAA
jgi:uncharacterized protein (DUF2336 family)